ncbi:MAG: GIY-YIG nuclease family protein [Bacteroidales bacterium]|nr:GIY-YIG nuclease family protein [Bacteroidales bacterium]MBR0453641.1 GIY-YIG nuclease family protein [Bacteroidales bacterium]
MIDWDKELADVLKDPVFADVKPTLHRLSSSDRLVRSFDEITAFVESNGRNPSADGNMSERMLYKRLEGIKSDKAKYDKCKPYDRLNLLEDQTEVTDVCSEPKTVYEETIEEEKSDDELLAEFLKDPIFNISPEAEAIFDLPEYMIKDIERAKADYIGKRVKCEDFEMFEPLFQNVHAELRNKKRKLIKFKEAHLQEGNFFVVGGVLTYLAKIHKLQKNGNHKIDGRIRCIYENGTESDILLRSLGKYLFNEGYTVTHNEDEYGYFERMFKLTDMDIDSGYIYVLKSRSNAPSITKYKNLYKIGFTTRTVEERIANAKNQATYLYADVEIVATWKIYNVKSVDVENAIHRLFDKVQLQLTAGDYTPKEWYVVPLAVINEAVNLLMMGKKVLYDDTLQQLITED